MRDAFRTTWVRLIALAGLALFLAGARAAEDPKPKLPPDVPAKVGKVLAYIDEHDAPPPNHVGGRTFLNEGRRDEEVLPRTDRQGRRIRYREWDVNPKVAGKNRGAERLVTGSDRSAFYTRDHYRTFTRIR